MQLKTLALTALLAGSAFAQCGPGISQITSPPNFVANNGGAIGGVAYFSLTVTAPNGISICGIDLNTSNTGPINGRVEINQVITDWNLLTGATNTPLDWCTVACITGTGMGDNNPSPCTIVSNTGTLDLPAGDYLLSIGQGNFNHRYTNGYGANQMIANADLGFSAGKGANTPYGASLFSPRVINTTLQYHVPVTPVTLSPCGQLCVSATCNEVGNGCGGAPATLAELFDGVNPWDLTGQDTLYVGTGGSVTVVSAAPTAFVTPVGPDLGLGDDQSSALIPLGFDLSAFGICADSISVQSNGCVWLGNVGSGDFSESLAELETQGARVCPYWNDLRPLTGGGGGTIHADVSPGVGAMVTFDQVFIWGGTVPVTFQIEIYPFEMRVRYDTSSAYASSALVGFHNGTPNSGTVSSDFSAGAGPVSGGVNLTLSCTQNPVIGGALGVELGNLPTGALGAVLATIGSTSPGVLQPSPPFGPGCETYIPVNSSSLGLVINAAACTGYPFGIAIPNDPLLLGLPIACQGAAVDVLGNQFLTSNAVDASVGNN